MTMTSQPEQTVPVQLHRAQGLLVLAAPMPGLEPQDISVIIHRDLYGHGRTALSSTRPLFSNRCSGKTFRANLSIPAGK